MTGASCERPICPSPVNDPPSQLPTAASTEQSPYLTDFNLYTFLSYLLGYKLTTILILLIALMPGIADNYCRFPKTQL